MDFSELMGRAAGHVEARIIQTAVELAIFDVLEATRLNAATVAQNLKIEEQATELLLNALTALGLLEKHGGSFSLTEVSRRHLLRRSPQYVGGIIAFDSMLWHDWEKLPEAIRTGLPTRAPDMYQSDARETDVFINAMDSLVKARGDAEVLSRVLDWSVVESILDVGSGPATYPIALCEKFSQLRATIVDLPGTLEITERFVRGANLSARIELIAGDYRIDPIPGIYDSIFLSNIIHGENHGRNATLIRKLAANLKPGGRLIVKDHILDDSRSQPPVGAIFSLLMLLTTDGGRCYSFTEIESWMQQAGMDRIEHIELPAPMTSSLVVAWK
jgi:3-hydroxy-5-methyl-1-naphthoate 3-O-methyltransferase